MSAAATVSSVFADGVSELLCKVVTVIAEGLSEKGVTVEEVESLISLPEKPKSKGLFQLNSAVPINEISTMKNVSKTRGPKEQCQYEYVRKGSEDKQCNTGAQFREDIGQNLCTAHYKMITNRNEKAGKKVTPATVPQTAQSAAQGNKLPASSAKTGMQLIKLDGRVDMYQDPKTKHHLRKVDDKTYVLVSKADGSEPSQSLKQYYKNMTPPIEYEPLTEEEAPEEEPPVEEEAPEEAQEEEAPPPPPPVKAAFTGLRVPGKPQLPTFAKTLPKA